MLADQKQQRGQRQRKLRPPREQNQQRDNDKDALFSDDTFPKLQLGK